MLINLFLSFSCFVLFSFLSSVLLHMSEMCHHHQHHCISITTLWIKHLFNINSPPPPKALLRVESKNASCKSQNDCGLFYLLSFLLNSHPSGRMNRVGLTYCCCCSCCCWDSDARRVSSFETWERERHDDDCDFTTNERTNERTTTTTQHIHR